MIVYFAGYGVPRGARCPVLLSIRSRLPTTAPRGIDGLPGAGVMGFSREKIKKGNL